MNNKPISKEYWDNLTGKQKWDVLSAMRGPDLHNGDMVKWVTTAVLRWKMSEVMRVGGAVNATLPVVVVLRDWKVSESFSEPHFFQHIQEAAYVLGVPQIHVPRQLYPAPLGELSSTTSEVVRALLRYCRTRHPHLLDEKGEWS